MAPNWFIILVNTTWLHSADLLNSTSFSYYSWAKNPRCSREFKKQHLFFHSAVHFLEPCTASYAYWIFVASIILSAKQQTHVTFVSLLLTILQQTDWKKVMIRGTHKQLQAQFVAMLTNLCTYCHCCINLLPWGTSVRNWTHLCNVSFVYK